MTMRLFCSILFFLFFSLSCTSSRWVVVDQAATGESESSNILSEKKILNLEQEPTVENPVMQFTIANVLEKEVEQRIRVERSIQRYRPKWGVWAIGITGAAFAGLAANTKVLQTSVTKTEKNALNITSGLIASLTFLQMKPAGDPILTGETRMMRRSGYETVSDTVNIANTNSENVVSISIRHRDVMLFQENNIPLTNGNLSLNIASFIGDKNIDGSDDAEVGIEINFQDENYRYNVPISNILMRYVEVNEPVALLRNAPAVSDLNIVTEVGEGSAFRLLDSADQEWYRVRFGGSDVFVQKSAVDIIWISEASSSAVNVFEFVEVPFGEIDVENSVPILRQNNPADRAVIITNDVLVSSESSQYTERDLKLFEFYMSSALQMQEDQIYRIDVDSAGSWEDQIRNIAESDSSGLLYVYLSGFTRVENGGLLFESSADSREPHIEISNMFDWFEEMNPGKMILLADLEFKMQQTSGSGSALQNTANELLRKIPNSALIFSHRPGQESSIYAGASTENKRHRIFPYYWAEALKSRNHTVSDIIRYLENNVDYTSRRLHDKPQEIQAFGNFTISVRE